MLAASLVVSAVPLFVLTTSAPMPPITIQGASRGVEEAYNVVAAVDHQDWHRQGLCV